MATYTSDMVGSKSLYRPALKGPVYTRSYTFPAPVLAGGDVCEVLPVVAGETVHDVRLVTDELDSGSALVLNVGDSTAGDRYLAGSDVGQSGGAEGTAGAGAPVEYAEDDVISVAVGTAPGTGVEGNITVVAYLS